MCYLANILTKEKFENNVFYNVVDSKDKLIPNIITLIIGWETTKEYKPNASILDWRIDDDTYWTFGKREKRERNENDIKRFKTLLMERIIKTVKYQFFNVLTSSSEEKKDFFRYLINNTRKFALLSNNMLYIYNPTTNICYGLLLTDIDYENGDSEKMLNLLYRSKNITFAKERDFISSDTKEIVVNKKYIIPYLSSIENS